MKRLWLLLGIFAVLFTGCGTPLAPVSPGAVSTPSPGADDKDPVFTSPVSVLPTPAGMEMGEIGAELSSLVANDLELPVDSLQLVSVESKTWGDTSLGCPQPGMAYAQILTDGWLVLFLGPDGQEIPVHTGADFRHYVICSGEFQPDLPGDESDISVVPVLRAAVSLLAETLDCPPEKVTVQGITQKQWNNSCLGCAKSGENCLMVITPGYQVNLQVEGRGYAVHTNTDGSALRVCEKSGVSDPGGN